MARSIGAAVEGRGLEYHQTLRADGQIAGDLLAQGRNDKAEQDLHQFRRVRADPDGVGGAPKHLVGVGENGLRQRRRVVVGRD